MAFGLTATEALDLTTIRVAGYRGDAMAMYSKGKAVKTLVVGLLVSALVPGIAFGASPATAPVLAQATAPAAKPKAPEASKPKAPEAGKPKVQETAVVTLRGTVEAIDKEKQTVTLKGPKRSLTLQVRDPKKLDAIKVGDPVVGKYYEALAIEVKKAGTASPGVTTQQATQTSKAGETPAGAIGQQVTLTATIVAIDKAAHTVTIKGPEGNTETVKARDPKNLEGVKEGDLVELTYTRALAIALDKSTSK
jgi:Cu/Ag efflux protein CusF